MKKTNVKKAGIYAINKHRGQLKRSTNKPYIQHPVKAAKILRVRLKRYEKELLSTPNGKKILKNSQELISALLLHDTIEDVKGVTYTELRKKFGKKVADLVRELTVDKPKRDKIGKSRYMREELLSMSSEALLLKLCDHVQNISDYPANINKPWISEGYMENYVKQTNQILEGIRGRIEKETILHKKLFNEIRLLNKRLEKKLAKRN